MLNLDKKKRYLLACSFGPDSMALFDMLLKNGVDFDVAHVNYHLREESNYEEISLRRYCEQKNKKIFVKNVEQSIKGNVEAACRSIRYSFFSDLYKNGDYDSVLVAHNQDDLIETYLMQKTRKNLVNCFGIAEFSVINGIPIRRPLLDHTKAQLQEYCDTNKIPYSIDKTNLERAYLRNRIRMDTVSRLTKEERKSYIDQIKQENEALDAIKNKIVKTTNDISSLLGLNDVELAYYLDSKIKLINPSFKLTHKCVDEVRDIMRSKKPNITLNVGGKISIIKEYSLLNISSIKKNKQGFIFRIEQPCKLDNEFFCLDFLGDTSNRNISLTDYPLTIRTYQSGDTYHIKNYSVQVRRLFIDWKMPMSLRKRWPIILNKDNKIVYIPRYREEFVPDSSTNFYVK